MKKKFMLGEPEARQMCQQLCTALQPCDLRNTRGDRAERLLEVLRYLEQFQVYLADEQFDAMITQAVLACGFKDEFDAWDAMVSITEPGKFVDVYGSMIGVPRDGSVDS